MPLRGKLEGPGLIEARTFWMHAWVFVMPHPYFAVSGPDGSFSISGLPAGTYTVEAWHQTLGTRLLTVTVPATGTATAAVAY